MQADLEKRLLEAIRSDRAPHAVLLAGSEGSDAYGIACRAAALYCTGDTDAARLLSCPDYFLLGPEAIPVDAVRELQRNINEKSFSGRRAVVFHEAHRMNANAQNALLKTLEEPPPNTLMLLTGQEAGLLPTILSRCMVLRLGGVGEEEIAGRLVGAGVLPKLAGFAAWLADGAPLMAEQFATEEHRALFDTAAKLYRRCLEEALPPYGDVKAMLDTTLPSTPKDAKSKAARQRPVADFCLRVWLQLSGDMLRNRLGAGEISGNNPAAAETARLAQRFTIREIQSMIELQLAAKKRLQVANPSLTMDELVTVMTAGH